MSGTEIEPERDEHGASPMVHIIGPLAAIAATWAVRRAMSAGYRSLSGSRPPEAQDPTVSWTRALLWTAVTASTAACVEVAIYRYLNSRSPKK